jgi:hypothetical protein
VLTAASFLNVDGARVYLTFDREIDFSGINVGAVAMDDGVNSIAWVGAGAAANGPMSVQVLLSNTGAYSGSGQVLNVGADSGIVAVDDGGTWVGVTGLALPYPPPPPPPPLVLEAAEYNADEGWCSLTFDRAIDVSGMDPFAIQIGDVSSGQLYEGHGSPTLVGDNQVQMALEFIGAFGGDITAMYATADSGIVAVDDGGTWEGATNLPLPWP